LKYAEKEACERRKQLLSGNRIDDRTIFAKQIVIRMQVNREQNLLPLFGFVFHSKDNELRQFAKTYHLHEVAWVSGRFIDISCLEIYPFAIDCAAFILGLSQQYSLIWSFYVSEEVNTERLITFILKQMNAVVANFVKEKESFIHEQLFTQVEAIWNKSRHNNNIGQLFIEFKETISENEVGKQYVEFIINELATENPRTYLLQTVIDSLYEHDEQTDQAKTVMKVKDKLLEKLS